MARLFSATDAKRIIERHQNIIEKLNNSVSSVEKYRTKAKEASDALVAQEVLKVLADIPIEEINRDKRGIRVKALKDYGYRTIADISTASVYSIASVHGISEDAAYTIKSIVNDIVSKARQGVKIRLSTDNRSREASGVRIQSMDLLHLNADRKLLMSLIRHRQEQFLWLKYNPGELD